MITNTLFWTRPIIVHAQGRPCFSPHWPRIRGNFFSTRPSTCVPNDRLTIITWNNDAERPGVFEKSLAHLGADPMVLGRGITGWVNSFHKPMLVADALRIVRSEYVLAVDSFDAISLRDPSESIACFEREFSCDLLFNAGKVCWPDVARFREFENSISRTKQSEFRYLNGGAWIGRTSFFREFFELAKNTAPLPECPQSEQGILKQLFIDWHPRLEIDYLCKIFQTLQYVFDPIFQYCDAGNEDRENRALQSSFRSNEAGTHRSWRCVRRE